MADNESHNSSMEKKRKYINDTGVPTFGKEDVSTAFNCLGCRKRKDGFRMKVYYTYEKKKNPDHHSWMCKYHHKLGHVCSEICYSMVVMRMS